MPRLVRRRNPLNRRASLVHALDVVRSYHRTLWWAGAVLAVSSSLALVAFAVVTLVQTQSQGGLPPLPRDSPFAHKSASASGDVTLGIDIGGG